MVFLHIPKTAGTTFTGVLRRQYGEGLREQRQQKGKQREARGHVGPVDEARAPRKINYFRNPAGCRRIVEAFVADLDATPRALAGHLPLSLRDLLPDDTRYITILRDPLERALSHHYFHASRGHPMWFSRLDNVQTRMLSGEDPLVERCPREYLELAKLHLRESLTSIGLNERFDESLEVMQVQLGWRDIRYKSSKVSPDRPRGDAAPAELRDELSALNQFDVELYTTGLEVFEELLVQHRDAIQENRESRAPELRELQDEKTRRIEAERALAQLRTEHEETLRRLEELERRVAAS